MTRVYVLACALGLLVACPYVPAHSIRVLNKTSGVIERVHVVIGKDRSGLGSVGPNVPAALIFSGDLPKQVTLEWMTGETKHEVAVDLGSVAPDFDGTIVLEVRDGEQGHGRAAATDAGSFPSGRRTSLAVQSQGRAYPQG